MTDVATERTLILVKPDGVARNLTGSILARVEAKGYRIVVVQRRRAHA
ncbi:MAG: nucleoside-diphosphate kinase [Jatrophihabitans sp.]